MLRRIISALLLCLALTVTAQQTSYRYWIDNDASTLRQGKAAQEAFSLDADLGSLAAGVHALHLQLSRDGQGWSAPMTRYFFVAASRPRPASCCYWFDNDITTIHQLTGFEPTINVDLKEQRAGLHALHFMTESAEGGPSVVYTRYFYLKDDPADELTLTAWFDNDAASAQTFPYTGDDVEVSTEQLQRGWHLVTAQLQNQRGDVLATDTLRFEVVRYKTIRLTTNADTYCADDDLDFSSVDGLRAYIIAGFNRQSYEVTALRISDAPAYEGLYIEGEPGEYLVPCKDSHTEYANLLRGTVETTMVQPLESGGYMNYVLDTDSGQPTFRPLFEATAIGPQKAWLHVFMPADHQRPLRIIRADEADAISSVSRQPEPDAVYTLSGRKLSTSSTSSLSKGVYIVNGKKMVIN